MRRNKVEVPKHRAGLNLREETKSAYARTYVLGQNDLYPKEGYDFPQRDVSKRKNLQKVSEDSPFNATKNDKFIRKDKVEKVIEKNRDDVMKIELACTKCAAKAVAMPTAGELRPINSEIAMRAVQKDRNAQKTLREKLRVAQMKEDTHWANMENDQAVETISINNTIFSKKKKNQQILADDYRHQFALHEKAKEEEKRQGEFEAEVIRQQQKADELKEQIRQENLRRLAHERGREFQIRNDELLQRREKRIEDDIASEKNLARQKSEVDQRMDDRARYDRTRRENSNRIRNRLIDNQAKQLAELQAQQQHYQGVAESECAKRQEMERKRQIQMRKEMREERNRDWIKSQREKDTKRMNEIEEPDFYDTPGDDLRRANEEFRHKKLLTLQKDQKWQIDDRRRKEKAESDIKHKYYDNQFFLKDNEW